MKVWAALFVCLMAVSGRRYWHRSRNAGNHNIWEIHVFFVPFMCVNRIDKTFKNRQLQNYCTHLEKQSILLVRNAAKALHILDLFYNYKRSKILFLERKRP